MDIEIDQIKRKRAQKSNRKKLRTGQEGSRNFHKLEIPKIIEIQIPPIHYNVSPLKACEYLSVPL